MSTLIDPNTKTTVAKQPTVKAAELLSQFSGILTDPKFGEVKYQLVHPVHHIDEFGEINGWIVSATSPVFDNTPKMFLSLIDMAAVDVSGVLPENLQDPEKTGLSQIQIIEQPSISFEFRKSFGGESLSEHITAMFDSIAIILSRKINLR